MKQVLFLIIFLASGIWFCSCGSHRSNLKQETSIESVGNHQRKDTASASHQVKKTEHEDVVETVEEVTTVYDTSLPADSTGRPPVLSETRKTTKRETNKRSQEDKSANLNQSTSVTGQDRTAIKAIREEDKQKKETTVPRQIGGIVLGVVALVGVGRIGWLVYKRKKR